MHIFNVYMIFPSDSAVKNLHAMKELQVDVILIHGSKRSPEGGPDNPLQYLTAWRIPRTDKPDGLVHNVSKSQTGLR